MPEDLKQKKHEEAEVNYEKHESEISIGKESLEKRIKEKEEGRDSCSARKACLCEVPCLECFHELF